MYFITPAKPGIFLIGIYRNRLYGFGENKKKKLCIYSKSVFDTGDWDEFFTIDIQVAKAGCCETGLHVAAGLDAETMWIAARDKELTRVFSIDIHTKQFIKCKMMEEIYEEYEVPDLNLCCKCLMPVIRYQDSDLNLHRFIVTPRRYQKEVGIFYFGFFINTSNHCLLSRSVIPFPLLPSTVSSNIAVNCEGEAFFVYEKAEDGTIKTLSIKNAERQSVANISEGAFDSTWHDITFFHDASNEMYCITRRQSDDNVLLHLCVLNFSCEDSSMMIGSLLSCTLDTDFPSFESSPFFLSYQKEDVEVYSSAYHSIFVKPELIVFQTADSIVTVPLRILTLRESAYLSLRQLPEPSPLPVAEVKFSIFKWIKWLFTFFLRKPKQVIHPWMSLNFITKALGLPNSFHLL